MNTSVNDYLYDTFSSYKLQAQVTGCYCGVCLDEDFNERVHRIPLRELHPHLIFFYIMAVGIIDGDGNDFKYFLPRILEVILDNEDVDGHFFTVVWKSLAEAAPYLNPAEKDAFRKFGEEYLRRAGETGNSEDAEYALRDLHEAGIATQ